MKIDPKITTQVNFTVALELDEVQARCLDAMVGFTQAVNLTE